MNPKSKLEQLAALQQNAKQGVAKKRLNALFDAGSFVEQVRGVDSSTIVNSLTEKELLEEAGRLDVPGRPILYQTTPNFLRCFGLSSLEDLPKLPDESGQLKMDDVIAGEPAEEPSMQEE